MYNCTRKKMKLCGHLFLSCMKASVVLPKVRCVFVFFNLDIDGHPHFRYFFHIHITLLKMKCQSFAITFTKLTEYAIIKLSELPFSVISFFFFFLFFFLFTSDYKSEHHRGQLICVPSLFTVLTLFYVHYMALPSECELI